MTRWYRGSGMRGTILPATIAVTASGIGVAVWAAGPYNDDGSDTLGDVAPVAITRSGANLVYRAMGSGQAENEMNAVPVQQSIGFMSRNFKSAILGVHGGWQPDTNNVLGLDAAVVVTAAYPSRMQDVAMPLDPSAPGKASVNSDFAVVMSGWNAAGTTDACRHPNRLAALNRITNSMHVDQIDHIYRRNDASGTTDTMRERVRIDRFCNGQAPGGVPSSGVGLYHNLDADDMDPIRRDCVPFGTDDPHKNQTRCTYWPYNATCLPGWDSTTNPVTGVPGGIPCTQGLIIALTDGDPDPAHPGSFLDVTRSIAQRVADDTTFKTIGYAGREAVKQAGTTAGPTINHISFADGSVRLGAYLLSRRLYLNHGDPLPNSGVGGANYDKQQQENTLYNWATDPDNGRCHMDPIIKDKGFVTCTQNCNLPPSGYNLCYDTPFPAAESLPALCIATGKNGNGSSLCCATGAASVNNQPCGLPVCAANGVPCRSNADCCANLTCQDTGGVAYLCKP